MTEASRTCGLPTCEGSPSATSSPASESGALLCVGPAGTIVDQSGRAVALASLSHRQVKAAGWEMSDICGQLGTTSSASAALQSCLESRLRARTQSLGSTLFTLTWKPWTTPSGRSRFRLRASVLRTSATACTGWPTSQASDHRPGHESRAADTGRGNLNDRAVLAAWPTAAAAAARDWKDGSECVNVKTNALLGRVAWPAGWGTPTKDEAGGTPEQFLARKEALGGTCGVSLTALNLQAQLAGWATPIVNDELGSTHCYGPRRPGETERQRFLKLPGQVQLAASGPTPTGSPAATAKPGQLNPAHSRWLMGLPPERDACAPTGTRSSRRKPKSGSKP